MNDKARKVKYTGIKVGAAALSAAVLFYWIVVANYREYRAHRDVSVVRSHLRALDSAIEAYALEWSEFPAWALDDRSLNGDDGPSFTLAPPGCLTTPIAFINSYQNVVDPFASKRGQGLSYYCGKEGGARFYLIWSPGPDRTPDLTLDMVRQNMSADERKLMNFLAPYVYDPTNGTFSGGDIYFSHPFLRDL